MRNAHAACRPVIVRKYAIVTEPRIRTNSSRKSAAPISAIPRPPARTLTFSSDLARAISCWTIAERSRVTSATSRPIVGSSVVLVMDVSLPTRRRGGCPRPPPRRRVVRSLAGRRLPQAGRDEVHHRGVCQRRGVPDLPVLGHVAQQPAHDLARAGL